MIVNEVLPRKLYQPIINSVTESDAPDLNIGSGLNFTNTLNGIMKDANALPSDAPDINIGSVTNPANSSNGFFNDLNSLQSDAPQINIGSGPKFTDSLNSFVRDVNTLQMESGNMTERFIKGEPVDIHDVMIAAEKAKTSFQLLMEMRNKFLDLYKEVLRMQV